MPHLHHGTTCGASLGPGKTEAVTAATLIPSGTQHYHPPAPDFVAAAAAAALATRFRLHQRLVTPAGQQVSQPHCTLNQIQLQAVSNRLQPTACGVPKLLQRQQVVEQELRHRLRRMQNAPSSLWHTKHTKNSYIHVNAWCVLDHADACFTKTVSVPPCKIHVLCAPSVPLISLIFASSSGIAFRSSQFLVSIAL